MLRNMLGPDSNIYLDQMLTYYLWLFSVYFFSVFLKPLFYSRFSRKGPFLASPPFFTLFVSTIALIMLHFSRSGVWALLLDRERQTNKNQIPKETRWRTRNKIQHKQRVYSVSFDKKTTQIKFQLQEARHQKKTTKKTISKDGIGKHVRNQHYTKQTPELHWKLRFLGWKQNKNQQI